MNHKPADTAICRTQSLITFFTALFLLVSFNFVHAQNAVDTRFLDSSTNADGSIALAEDVSQAYQSTAEAIITYETLGQTSSDVVSDARAYLSTTSVESTENLALRLLTSSTTSPDFSTTLTQISQR